jgi:hypothetical protein
MHLFVESAFLTILAFLALAWITLAQGAIILSDSSGHTINSASIEVSDG